jgi:acetyl-CoA synthetase
VADVVYRPDPARIARSHLQRFLLRTGCPDLDALRARAAADPAWFWREVEQDLGLAWYTPYRQVLDTSAGVPFARWFVGGEMNAANDALDKHVATARRRQLALVWEGEDGAVRRLSYFDLWQETNRLANALVELGVGSGDRVGLYLPMVPEAAAALLACAKLGAVAIPMFSGYGAEAVATRLREGGARVLVTADGFYRRGRPVLQKPVADEAAAACPDLARVLVVRRLGADVPWQAARDLAYEELVPRMAARFPTRPLPAEHPLMILYTSGTTGRPKGALHVHAGFPLKAAQDLAHCFDLQGGDLLFWYTDMGWMMGPWEVFGALWLGSTMLFYEGTPDYPQPDRLWALCARHGVTHLGLSPTAVRALMAQGEAWVRRHDLSQLYVLGSTGEPWNPDPWRWYFEVIGGGRCPIINYSGGTEISGGILGCFPHSALKPCAFAGPIPGVAAEVLDEQGRPVRGSVGELCITGPWPGMTRGFWQDRERYLETYWSRWPDVWVHGDWAHIDADGFWYIEGRSDDTLKVAGKRVGPAEVESALVAHPAVREAAAVGVPDPVKGEAIVCFAILVPGREPDEALRAELRAWVGQRLGRALTPQDVRFVTDLPRTRNAKIMRRAVRAAYLGLPAGDLSALENPQALAEVRQAR